jgi:hypothetical protein
VSRPPTAHIRSHPSVHISPSVGLPPLQDQDRAGAAHHQAHHSPGTPIFRPCRTRALSAAFDRLYHCCTPTYTRHLQTTTGARAGGRRGHEDPPRPRHRAVVSIARQSTPGPTASLSLLSDGVCSGGSGAGGMGGWGMGPSIYGGVPRKRERKRANERESANERERVMKARACCENLRPRLSGCHGANRVSIPTRGGAHVNRTKPHSCKFM